MKNETRIKIERQIARKMLRKMAVAGFKCVSVFDGEENIDASPGLTLPEGKAMDAIFSVDESRVYFQKDGLTWSVLLVLGNCEDIISDNSLHANHPVEDNAFEAVLAECTVEVPYSA